MTTFTEVVWYLFKPQSVEPAPLATERDFVALWTHWILSISCSQRSSLKLLTSLTHLPLFVDLNRIYSFDFCGSFNTLVLRLADCAVKKSFCSFSLVPEVEPCKQRHPRGCNCWPVARKPRCDFGTYGSLGHLLEMEATLSRHEKKHTHNSKMLSSWRTKVLLIS